jgi:hypothetical protein
MLTLEDSYQTSIQSEIVLGAGCRLEYPLVTKTLDYLPDTQHDRGFGRVD